MLEILTGHGDRRRLVRVYNEWDIAGEEVVDWPDITEESVGKLVKFDDGSDWYVRITHIALRGEAVRTEAGVYRRSDLVHVCRIKMPHSHYSGLSKEAEHPLARPYTPREKFQATRILRGTYTKDTVSQRIKMLVLERMQEEADRHGVTEEYIISRLKHWSDGDNRHALEALKTLARIKGAELNQETKKEGSRPIGLFQQINNYGTVQDERRTAVLPRLTELREIVQSTVGSGDFVDLEGVPLPLPRTAD